VISSVEVLQQERTHSYTPFVLHAPLIQFLLM